MKMLLNLFEAGGEAAGTAAGNAEQGEGKASEAAAAESGLQAEEAETKDNETEPQETQTKVTSDARKQREAEFNKLITGEYKDLYNESVNRIMRGRAKELDGLKTANQKMNNVLGILSEKYGTDDPDRLYKAISEDNTFFEEAAMKAGLTVEQYKEMQRIKRENENFRRAQQIQERERRKSQIIGQWKQEADSLKNIYPSFNFDTEAANPQFTRLLGAGVGVKAAYETIHMDEIMSGAMAYTADTVTKKVTNNIRARGARPIENGAQSGAAAAVKTDVSKLTKEERANLVKRALSGETISL